MDLKLLLKPILSSIIKLFLGKRIVSKQYGQDKIYYEQSQHLMFLFKKHVDYEANIQEKVKEYIKKSNLIFDIGGNIGQYALFFSEFVEGNGRVISFEPDYKNFSFLQFNVNINNLKNVLCLKCGINKATIHL